jgi:hypothetical protein
MLAGFLVSAILLASAHADGPTSNPKLGHWAERKEMAQGDFTLSLQSSCKPGQSKDPKRALAPVELSVSGERKVCAEFLPYWGLEGYSYFDGAGKTLKTRHHQPPASYVWQDYSATQDVHDVYTRVIESRKVSGATSELESVLFNFGVGLMKARPEGDSGRLQPASDSGMIFILETGYNHAFAFQKRTDLSAIVAKVGDDSYHIYESAIRPGRGSLGGGTEPLSAHALEYEYHETGTITRSVDSASRVVQYDFSRASSAELNGAFLFELVHVLEELREGMKLADLSRIRLAH